MLVTTWVEIAQQVMASIEEMQEDDRPGMTVDCITRAHRVIASSTDLQIERLNDKQRIVIADALRRQAARFYAA
jgi:hypothetical protein